LLGVGHDNSFFLLCYFWGKKIVFQTWLKEEICMSEVNYYKISQGVNPIVQMMMLIQQQEELNMT